jgi:signal transduction histidine kinase
MKWGRSSTGRAIAPVDVAVAGFMLVLGQLEVALRGVDGGDPLAAHVLWGAIAVCALARRSHPLLFALAAVATSALRYRYGLTPSGGAVFAILMPLALYGVGAYGRDPVRSAWQAGAVLLLEQTSTAVIALSGHGPFVDQPAPQWLGQFSIYFVAACGGLALRDRTEVLRAARARVAATPTVEQAADRALLEERTRIARELHAVVTASVRELLEEVNYARGQVESSPRRAREALAGARATCRRALDEIRRVLSLLRAPGPPPGQADPSQATPPGGPLPLARIPAPVRAQALPLLVLAVGVLEAVLSSYHPHVYGSAPMAVRVLGAVALAAAFLPRRRHPTVTAAAVGAIYLLRVSLDDSFALNLSLYLAVFVAGSYSRSLAAALAGGLVVTAAAIATPSLVDEVLPLGAYVYVAITTGAAWATGLGCRRRLAEAAELRELAEEERRRNQRAAGRAVAEERMRVARELHDLVGHALTSIVLQCAAAERLAQDSPGEALAAIDSVEGVGAEVEAELADLLAALEGTDPVEAPRLERVPQLARGAEASGMKVDLEIEGDVERVPAGPAGAAYRIVQEGLTNARKHGTGERVRVRLAVVGERLRIEVENPFEGRAEGGAEGHGLIGISERVRVYGGHFRAGPTERGYWLVEAELPLAESRSPTLTSPLS